MGFDAGVFARQRMRFWTAIYFAVTSISTAGLEGLKPFKYSADEDGNIEMNPYTFYTRCSHARVVHGHVCA